MEYIILIIFGYVMLKWLAGILRHIFSQETVATLIIAFGFMMAPGCAWIGFGILAVKYILIPFSRMQVKRESRDKSTISTRSLMWLIPVAWPFLIFGRMMRGKTLPNDNTPFDYEEHLKHGGH
jgi:hypothetical protein